ncbi:MAG: cell division protein ZapA [Eubacteriaceae bacterium]|jgi:cell division protein ZapA|nr:cell division protein ZapA [Eubacteriaceae bacterium]
MANEKQKITVNIMGVDYQIVTDDDPTRVQRIATLTDKLIKDTKGASPLLTNTGAAVLSALNLCEELFRCREEMAAFREKEELYEKNQKSYTQLTEALRRLDEEESVNKILQSRLDKAVLELNDTNDMLEEYKDKFNALRTEYELNKRTLSELQSKFLENQIELVKARKTLLDFDD